MKPILKWTGGKSSELSFIKPIIPKFNRFVEPFVGGGAVFFDLECEKSILNDFNFELISFYNLWKTPEQIEQIYDLVSPIQDIRNKCANYSSGDILEFLKSLSDDLVYQKFVDREFNSKVKTLNRLEEPINPEQLLLTAGYAASYYMAREYYNLAAPNEFNRIAYWYVMRELAYSGMFRYSSAGKFNVPYGGVSYNTKNLMTKIEYGIKLGETPFYKNAEFNNFDFEHFFEKYNLFEEDDFIFVDPPYDTEFSQYNKEEDFDSNDQIRLRDVLLKSPAQIMLVVKGTPFINEIYKDFNISQFDKTYQVNMKNRNDKAVEHLIITNF